MPGTMLSHSGGQLPKTSTKPPSKAAEFVSESNKIGRMKTVARLLVLCILPAAAYGHVSGLPIHVTGGAVDGGHTCAQCHSGGPGVNLGGGRMSIITSAYAPGITQTITVTVQDASMLRFGFQLTARIETDESRQAGSFSDRPDSHVFCDPDSNPGPCAGAAEYVTHTPDSTQAGSSGTRTFICGGERRQPGDGRPRLHGLTSPGFCRMQPARARDNPLARWNHGCGRLSRQYFFQLADIRVRLGIQHSRSE